MRLPKNFQPVGTSKYGRFFFLATRSSAPDVGMDRAQPLRPPAFLNCGMRSALATIMASESEGDTKNCEPRIMFLSASPSAPAPKEGIGFPGSIFSPFALRPMVLTSSTAYVRFGSACPCHADSGPPKSGLGSAFVQEPGLPPSVSSRIFLAYGPCTPLMESMTKLKSGFFTRELIWPKSKHSCKSAMWSSTQSKTSMILSPIV
mmetsp:Transcript_4501/g.14436  ORF Transcript_4501/g.14436 Transcript_4501/m.14436 type:complete len:204 (-) Transcript_4501:1010-1621(-)